MPFSTSLLPRWIELISPRANWVVAVFLLSASFYVTRQWWGKRPVIRTDPIADLARVVKEDPRLVKEADRAFREDSK